MAEPLPGREPLPSRDTQLIESPHVWITEKAKVDAEVQYSTLLCVPVVARLATNPYTATPSAAAFQATSGVSMANCTT